MEDHIWPESAIEITQLIKGTPAWERCLVHVREWKATGRSIEWLSEHIVEELKDEWDLDELVESFDAMGLALDNEQRPLVRKLLGLHMAAAVVADAEGVERPLLPMMAGGVQVIHHKEDEFEVPMVIAIASPLTSGTVTRQFEEMCDRTFAASLGEHEHAVRDAEWFRRRQAGEHWTDIAKSDPRSGISAEARANPKEYPEDVRKAANRVSRAAHRYREKWTKMVDSMSANPD